MQPDNVINPQNSSQKQQTQKNSKLMPVILVVLVLGIGLFALFLYQQISTLKSENNNLAALIQQNKEALNATDKRLLNAPFEAYTLKRLSYDSTSNMLFIPELNIKVPYTDKAGSLLYAPRLENDETTSKELDVVTSKYLPPSEQTQHFCANFLRLKIEDQQNPYNPAEVATSFKLRDGRTLQVYYFTGELEGNDQCKKSYEASVAPKDFVEVFTNVESY